MQKNHYDFFNQPRLVRICISVLLLFVLRRPRVISLVRPFGHTLAFDTGSHYKTFATISAMKLHKIVSLQLRIFNREIKGS